MKKVNLGCGEDVRDGYINVDRLALEGVDIVHDLDEFPYPFQENEVDEVYCQHVLEHVCDLVRVMEELHRILAPGGVAKIIGPYFASHGAFNDPTHKQFMTYRTFDYFSERSFYTEVKFRIGKIRIMFFSGSHSSFMRSKAYSWPIDFLINLAPVVYQRFFCHLLPASEIHYLLEAVE